jgi:putative oxidoreductase
MTGIVRGNVMLERIVRKSAAPTLSLMRIIVGFLFFPHGGQKILGWFGGMRGTGATASFPDLVWFGGVLELFGGLLIMLGVFTRPVAFLLAGEMAVAYFKAHASGGFLPLVNHGELAVLYCFVFLFLAANGGGPYSIERLWQKKA